MYEESTIGVIFTTLTGIASVLFLFYTSRKEKDKVLKSFFLCVFWLNIIWITNIFSYYLAPLFSISGSSPQFDWFGLLMSTFIFLFRFGLLLSMITMVLQLTCNINADKYHQVLRIAVIISTLIWFAGFIEIIIAGRSSVNDQMMFITDILIFGAILSAAIFLRFKGAAISDLKLRQSILNLSLLFIIPITLGLIKWVVGISLESINLILERYFIYLIIALFNLMSIWWTYKYASVISGYKVPDISEESFDFDDFISKYNISKRESEVIQLICRGKSNKEIGDELFISVETVKDHNHKIFRKTNVKSRSQLMHLVMESKKKV